MLDSHEGSVAHHKGINYVCCYTDIGTLVTRSPDIANDHPVITGTGTSVRRVVVLYKQGANVEEIARQMSHLSLSQVYAILTYYHANRDEIEADLMEPRFAISNRIRSADHIVIVATQTGTGVVGRSTVRSNIRAAYRRCPQR